MERDTKTHVNSCQTTEVGSPVERVVMFTRTHTLPKSFWKHCTEIWELSPRARYIKNQSYLRYLRTTDGKYIDKFLDKMKPEIGIIDGIRFIET